MRREKNMLTRALLFVIPLCLLLAGTAGAACSSYVGQVTLNEVFRLGGTRFVEVKILDPSLGAPVYNGWSLRVCDAAPPGGCSTYNLSTATVTYPYLTVNNVNNINLNSGAKMDVVLFDGLNAAGNAIDYLSVNSATFQNPACAPFIWPTLLPTSTSNKKGVFRNPDGIGEWGELIDSGGGGQPTEGGDNTSSTVGSFNAYDTGTAQGAVVGNITTKEAGELFQLAIVAISSQAINTTYNKMVSIQLLDASDNSQPLVNTCRSSWVAIQGPITVTFAAADNGRKAVSFQESNAWRNVRVRVSEVGGTAVGCSLDNFAIRPAAFTIEALDADWQTDGTSRSLANVAATGGNVHAAGRPFSLRATARNQQGVVTTNYSGQPQTALTQCAGTACLGTGTLIPGAWSAANGVIITSATYSEAGSFNLTLEDRTFAGVDVADGSTTSQRYVASTQAVGRFVPHDFLLTPVTAPVFKTFNDAACVARSFTYIGQPFGYATAPVAGITARNAAGDTTAHYAGGLWKIAASQVTQTYAPLPPLVPALDTGLVGVPTVTSNGNGTGTVTNGGDTLAFFRNGASAPFNASISLALAVADSSEAAVAGNGTINAAPLLFDGGGPGIAFDAGNQFRFGRMALLNAYGPEILPLAIPLRAEYFDGSAFIPNLADNCTPYSAAALSPASPMSVGTGTTSATGVGILSGGRDNPVQPLTLTAPGSGGSGSVNLSFAGPAWLRFDWDGNGVHDNDPAARATFGIYKGNPRVIFTREVY